LYLKNDELWLQGISEMVLYGKTEVFGGNQYQFYFVHKTHVEDWD